MFILQALTWRGGSKNNKKPRPNETMGSVEGGGEGLGQDFAMIRTSRKMGLIQRRMEKDEHSGARKNTLSPYRHSLLNKGRETQRN